MHRNIDYTARDRFFARFPNLPLIEQDSGNKSNTVVLIPLFDDTHPRREGNCRLIELYAQGAVWTFYSFLNNTDAILQNVAVKFYVEDKVKNFVYPILRENHISESDIIEWHWTFSNHGVLSKKLYAFLDEHLRHYKHVFIADSDLWVVRSETNEGLPMFETLFNSDLDLTLNICANQPPSYTIGELLSRLINRTHQHQGYFEKILKHPEMLKKSISTLVENITSFLYVFSPKEIRQKYPKFFEFVHDYGHVFGNDEEILALAKLLGYLDFQSGWAQVGIRAQGTSYLKRTPQACVAHNEISGDNPELKMTRAELTEYFYKRLGIL